MSCYFRIVLTGALLTFAACSTQTSRTAQVSKDGVAIGLDEYHVDCPGSIDVNPSDGVNFYGVNDIYVTQQIGSVEDDLDEFDVPVRSCYYNVNVTERMICSVYAYLNDALSLNPSTAQKFSAEDKLRLFQASLVHLRQASRWAVNSFWVNVCPASASFRRNPEYRRYLATQLAEVLDLTRLVAEEGAPFLQGLADSAVSDSGSFDEQMRSIWGEHDINGLALVDGRRATALSLFYGAPWENLVDTTANADVFAALPGSRVNEADPLVAKAIQVLNTYGLPVSDVSSFGGFVVYRPWTAPSDVTMGERCLTSAVNRSREALQLPPINFGEVLSSLNITGGSLVTAAQALFGRTSAELYDIRRREQDGCIYLSGFESSALNIQPLVLRSRAGLYKHAILPGYANQSFAVNGVNGLEPMFSRLSDVRDCLVEADCPEWLLNGFASEVNESNLPGGIPFPQVAIDQVEAAYESLRPAFGQRHIDYMQFVPANGVVGTTDPYLVATVDGFTAAERGKLRLYRVEKKFSEAAGINSGYYDVLSCIKYGRHSRQAACALSQWDAGCDFAPNGACVVTLPWESNSDPTRLSTLVLATDDGQILDMYHERRPTDFAADSLVFTRHHTHSPMLAHKADRITRRSLDNRSQPYFNALDLPNDLAVPVENELTSDSDNYEDSFSFYVDRATAAAADAQEKIQHSIAESLNAQTAEQRIENAQQDALDRIEQICGAGNSSCGAAKGEYVLGDLGLLPDTGVPACTEADIPEPGNMWNPLKGLGWYIDQLVDYARCSGQSFIDGISTMPLYALPTEIKTAAESGGLTNLSFENYGGEYKIKLLDIKQNFTDLRSAVATIQETYKALAWEAMAKKKELKAMQLENAASVLKQIGDLLNPSQWVEGAAIGGVLKAFAAGCGAVAGALKKMAETYSFVAEIIHKIGAIEQAALTIEKAVTGMQQNIEGLKLLELEQEQSQSRADRLADEILTQYVGDSTQQLKAFRKLTLMSAVRARRSLRRAKKMSFIASRALEMKLAVKLSEENEAGVIGDPPSTWVSDLYKIGYVQSIFNPNEQAGYAIANYVQQLGDYVYNYPFQYPFADGTDAAVMSLRDDLSQLKDSCREVDSLNTRNLLAHPEAFDQWYVSAPDGRDSWPEILVSTSSVDVSTDEAAGYQQLDDQTADRANYVCYSNDCIRLMSGGVLPSQPAAAYTGSVYAQTTEAVLRLSVIATYRCVEDSTVVTEVLRNDALCNLSPETHPGQDWVRCTSTLSGVRAADDPLALCQEGESVAVSVEVMPSVTVVQPPFPRKPRPVNQSFVLWGAQLEEGAVATAYQAEPVYTLSGACLDSGFTDPQTGDPIYYMDPVVKSQRLRDSFSIKCVDDDFALPTRTVAQCGSRGGVDYYERSFSLTLEGVENGTIVQQGQIGVGNYNYRTRSLVLNLVGSNVKDCSLDPGGGTSCYANQFISYDLLHDGRVKIRNHSGVALPFKLANGKIHGGKAIAAERLLTNPLSSTDQSLVQQYLKDEFRGRPIQGAYTIRIHHTPSLRWDNIEDVQVLLNYRYWSPFSTQ